MSKKLWIIVSGGILLILAGILETTPFLKSFLLHFGKCKTNTDFCVSLYSLYFMVFLVIILVIAYFIFFYFPERREKSKLLSNIQVEKFYDVPLPIKSGIIIKNDNPLMGLVDIEIELIKLSWIKKSENDELIILREGALQDNHNLGKWAGENKFKVNPGGHEVVYFVEIVNKKAVFFLNKRNGEYENDCYQERVAESSFEVIFDVRGLCGTSKYHQGYSAVFKYDSSAITRTLTTHG